ncbi:MAG: hypothetical protein LPD71_06145 [Shewanella sp.]|nr:hypothetical protein [Shewanella sp.]MCF1429970.1 hypothetical protein [Shewanella sp.]MCF1438327.1 hypothetical protein [Shewanella sp.]MCF1459355.1 hypothetical protein [Shewanella sp.]
MAIPFHPEHVIPLAAAEGFQVIGTILSGFCQSKHPLLNVLRLKHAAGFIAMYL